MLKRKTDGMPNLKGQELSEVVSTTELLSDENEAATKEDIEFAVNSHNASSDAHAELFKKKSEFVTVTIPAGRMLGDVNNDGKVDMKDAALINDYIAKRVDITDTNTLKYLDANNDGGISVNDISHARNVGRGNLKYGKQPDLSKNQWIQNTNYSTEYYQFYKDIVIEGLTEENSAILFVPDYGAYEVIAKVECKENAFRIYVTRCPISEVKCRLQIFEGDGTAEFVYSGEAVITEDFEVTVTKNDDSYTTDYYFGDIKNAHANGKNVVLHYDGKTYFLSNIDGKRAMFTRTYADNPQDKISIEAFIFIGEYVFYMSTELNDEIVNTPQIAMIEIPAGRMVGDVNGDGLINQADVDMISKHVVSDGTYLTDETQIECADTDPNGVISSNDRNYIRSYMIGGCRLGRFSKDVLENWTINPNYEDEDGQFYFDIDIDGMTSDSSANILISGSGIADNYYAECLDGKLRIYAKLCPITSLRATVIWYEGDGSTVVEFASDEHPVRFSSIKIPAGRMMGDVNEDGRIDELDAILINDYLAGRKEITDELALECLDADGSGYVNSADADHVRDINRGTLKYGTQPDIFGKWEANPNYKREDGQFYADIDVAGLSESSSVVIFVPDYSVYQVIVKAECLDGKIRIYTKRCPLTEVTCKIQIFAGDGSAEVVYSGANIPEADAKVLYFTNKSVKKADFKSSSEYEGYPYRAKIALSGVTEKHSVDVIFDDDDALSGNYAQIAKTSDNYVTIYAKTIPSSTIVIPVIKCEKVVKL